MNHRMDISVHHRCRCRLLHLLWPLLACFFCLSQSAEATIVYIAGASGRVDNLPTDGTPGTLTIPKPAGTAAGQALIVTIAARPSSMTVGVPAGFIQMTFTNQPNGGISTAPGGMSLITYYKIATTSEPASYSWTFANPSNGGGSAVGGILAFSGIDTAGGNPINVFSTKLTPDGLTHSTNSITTTVANTMIVSSISYLSASSFGAPTGITGLTERLDQSAPVAANAIGTTLQMSTVLQAAAGASGATQATAGSDADTGVGHLMALKPSAIDPGLTMTRGGPLNPGGTAAYTLTVTNNGINAEPGPLTIVDTLPTGLTYTSFTGTGWSCSVAGQVITCTRPGSLAAGATAPALVLNVAIGAAVSGAVTNTATVSGTGGDGNTANNTATDTYIIPSQAYAYYALDETSWGTILDSSGNSRNASVLGTATPTGPVVPTPPGAAIVGNPGTCGAGRIPAGTTAIGINTGIDVNSLGNAGTIMFWYSSNTVWNDGTSRILFDASNDLGNGGADKHFFLVKDGSGILRFALEDSADTDSTAATASLGFAANTWHHIAVTWDIAGRRAIYVDGSLTSGVAINPLNGTLGNTAALYLGARRPGTINGTPTGYTTNTANGFIDEVRLYSAALSAEEIAQLVNFTHPCTAVDHYELSLPTTGLTCLGTTVTVTACANASNPCTSPATTVNGATATLATSAGTLGSTTVTFNASGVATTSLAHPNALDGAGATVTLSGESTPATNARKCCPNGTSCSNANSCSTTFNTTAFFFTSAPDSTAALIIPNQVAGVSSASYVLRAVKTNNTTKACESALAGTTPVDFAYECNNPTTCSNTNLMSITIGGTSTVIARNNNAAVSTYTPVNLTFDANGNAPFTFTFSDVGLLTLYARKAPSGLLTSTLSGMTNAFVTTPFDFLLSNIQCSDGTDNPGATDATGGRFCKAGDNFSVTVTARAKDDKPTPNYGREISPKTVKLTAALVSPSVGASPALGNAIGFGSFSNGQATGNAFNWGEVGIISLTPSVGDVIVANDGNYLGAGNVTGTAVANVGRFIPHNFQVRNASLINRADITNTANVNMGIGCAPASTFTYMDELFQLNFNLTARNKAGTTTANYAGAFAKFVPTVAANWGLLGIQGGTTFAPAPAPGGRLTAGTSTGTWAMGTITGATLTTAVTRAAAPDGPFNNIALGLLPLDSDGVTLLGTDLNLDTGAPTGADRVQVGTVNARFGRLRMSNAVVPQNNALNLPLTAEFWNGSLFITNPDDNCTPIPVSAINLGNYQTPAGQPALVPADTNAQGNVTLTMGRSNLVFTAPANNHIGTFDVGLSLGRLPPTTPPTMIRSCLLDNSPMPPTTTRPPVKVATATANLPYLLGDWCNPGIFDRDPSARASFGLRSGSNNIIYTRENY